MLTKEEALNLRHGQILYHVSNKNADGSPQRWRVNGKVKTWKTMPDRIEIPIKYGLYHYDTLTTMEFHLVSLHPETLKYP
jgi:hypothetical protein